MAKYVRVASVTCNAFPAHKPKEAKKAAIRLVSGQLQSLAGYGLDLIVFSEAVESQGQTVDTAEATAQPGPLLNAYCENAVRLKTHIAGSVKLREGKRVYNSIAFIGPDGKILGAYHKSNLTIGEIDQGLTSGQGAVVVDTPIGRLGGAVCFDLNFHWLRDQYKALKPDIICFSSAYHGGLMQKMWAYDCRAFFISALPFLGGGILDPFGRPVKLTDCYTSIARATLNLDRVMVHLDFNREKFPEIEKKYLGEVVIDIPANIAPALIYSTTNKRTAMDIVREFELELIDDYFARALKRNAANRPQGKIRGHPLHGTR
ncbi:MAG: carbon-nitrogen hydrolase family protein [Kiritimatiellaeota bacterium]|nr:carbon-nitrogen hydrolase family protein [Kiritimatiellota bacterium]